jgi:hypothetical protein
MVPDIPMVGKLKKRRWRIEDRRSLTYYAKFVRTPNAKCKMNNAKLISEI